MKRVCIWLFVVIIATAFAVAAHAREKEAEGAGASSADKSYTNGDFKFELKYPGDWDVKETKPQAAIGGGLTGAIGQKLLGGLRMVTVCFGSKKCEAGDFGKDPQAQLVVSDIKSMENLPFKGEKDRAEKGKAERAEAERSECDIVERTNVKWAGKNAPWLTMRCPDKKKWRYTTTVSMQRSAAKSKDMFSLMCSMLSKSKEKGESLAEFNAELKPRCTKLVSTTKFIK